MLNIVGHEVIDFLGFTAHFHFHRSMCGDNVAAFTGDYARSIALGIVLVALAFVLNMGLAALRRRMGP